MDSSLGAPMQIPARDEAAALRDPAEWVGHTSLSDPYGYAATLIELPLDIHLLNRIVQGVLVHCDWLALYGLDRTGATAPARRTLPIAGRLKEILDRDPRSLTMARRPEARAIGTCRDFALMLSAMLRTKGVPARLRCGFASYIGGGWQDHWICEYFDGDARRWRSIDPQLDGVLGEKYRIDFDPTDVPDRAFITAGQAWLYCRAGRSGANRFGHGDTNGAWFMKVNVVRDHYSLNGQEVSAWDEWRAAPSASRRVNGDESIWLDSLARVPEQQLVMAEPDWVVA